jgi:CubicO group peptidase (beta-lactamase class C family)
MKDYTSLPQFGAIASRTLPRDSLIAMFKVQPFDFKPGELQLYTNSAYFLAGLIIEKTSGESYAAYIKKHLFDKAGMPDSRYCSESAIIPRKAHGYDMGAKGLENKAPLSHVYPFSAGSICSTAGDIAAWNRALHGGKVLSAAAYRDITTPSRLNDGTTIRYAKGLVIQTFDGRRVIEHAGGINGFLSQSTYYPDGDVIIVVLINTGGPVSPTEVAKTLANVVLAPVKTVSATYTGDLAAFAGEYNGPGRGRPMKIKITAKGGQLYLAAEGLPKSIDLSYRPGDRWEHDGQLVTFVRAGGKVTKMTIDQAYGYSVLTKK